MYGRWVTDKNSWNNNLVAAFIIRKIRFVHFILIYIYIVYLCHKSHKISPERVYIEFNKGFKVCRKFVVNFTISKSSADFASLSVSLFPCIPIWLGIQQKLTILHDWKHKNNCKIYPRCMYDQYSYYEETGNRKVNVKIL